MSVSKPVITPISAQAPRIQQKLWTANFILICLSNLTVYIGFHAFQPTLPIYIQNLGGSKSVAGLALAAITLAAVFVRPFTGWALDNFGRKFILAVGLLTFLFPTLIYISMIGIVPLLILRIVQGFGWGIANTAQGTTASDIIPPNSLGKGLGIYGMTISVSMAIAPGLGLWLIDTFSFQALFITLSVLTVASLIFAMSIKYPKLAAPPAKTKLVFYEKMALWPSLVVLMIALTYSSVVSFTALFARQQGLSTAGLYFTSVALTTLICRPLSGSLVDKKGRSGYDAIALIGMLSTVISMVLLAEVSSTWLLIISGIFFGIGFGSLQPAMLALSIISVPPERRGAANATYWTAFDIGIAAGSVLWGMIANYFGYGIMFIMNIIPPLAGILIYWFARKQIQKSA